MRAFLRQMIEIQKEMTESLLSLATRGADRRLPRRHRSDGEVVMSDLGTTISDLGTASARIIERQSTKTGSDCDAVSDHYAYRTTWSAEDEAHVGLCAEFPSLTWLAATPDEALSGVRRLVRSCLADMRANGEPVPEPLAEHPTLGSDGASG